jgi:hypothetical protein
MNCPRGIRKRSPSRRLRKGPKNGPAQGVSLSSGHVAVSYIQDNFAAINARVEVHSRQMSSVAAASQREL